VLDATFACPDLSSFCRLDELGLEVIGQHLEPERAVLACRTVVPDRWCRRCGCQGARRDSVTRRLAHEPFGWRPTTLLVTISRSRCTGCGHVWRQDISKAAEPRAKLTRGALRWALEGIVCQHLTVVRVVEALGVAWNTANDTVLAEGRRVLLADPTRFDGVKVIGVDEHVWRHTRNGDKYITVIIDLTGIRDGSGPARLLNMVQGRSKQAFQTWLAARPKAWRDGVKVVAMDGFTGFKTATSEELPEAVAVMDPFPRRPARWRRPRPVPPARPAAHLRAPGPQGRTALRGPSHPAHRRRPAHRQAEDQTRSDLRRRRARAGRGDLADLPADDRRLPPPRPRSRRQDDEQAHPSSERRRPRPADRGLITLGRTLKRRAADVLAYFTRPGTSNGPTEAINGRLEHLRGSALGFRNLTNYIARSLLETGGFRPRLHPRL